jgi:hypothetical protein
VNVFEKIGGAMLAGVRPPAALIVSFEGALLSQCDFSREAVIFA